MGLRCQRQYNLQKSLSEHCLSQSFENEDEDTIESKEMIQSDIDSWIKYLNTIQDIHFEQRESPIEDKMTQINLGDEAILSPFL